MTQPRRLGRYELLEQLREGGMGAVWLARRTGAHGFEKLVIVKTVLAALAKDQAFVSRFLHQGRVLARLNHANVAAVCDLGEDGGTLYLALEYVPGVDLARLHDAVKARGERVPLAVALFFGQHLCEGLGAAHRARAPDGTALDLVHRDVSPQHVMVSYEGEVKVIDFGVSRSEARSELTAQAMVMGKLGYLAPEQARGEPLDARADQYAAAVVLWELLASQPFVPRGTMTEMMVAMAQPRPHPLGAVRAEVPAALEAVLQRALSPEPAARFATADDLAEALHGQLVALGAMPTKAEVGRYVRERCGDADALQQRLASTLAALPARAQAPGAPTRDDSQAVPREAEPPASRLDVADAAAEPPPTAAASAGPADSPASHAEPATLPERQAVTRPGSLAEPPDLRPVTHEDSRARAPHTAPTDPPSCEPGTAPRPVPRAESPASAARTALTEPPAQRPVTHEDSRARAPHTAPTEPPSCEPGTAQRPVTRADSPASAARAALTEPPPGRRPETQPDSPTATAHTAPTEPPPTREAVRSGAAAWNSGRPAVGAARGASRPAPSTALPGTVSAPPADSAAPAPAAAAVRRRAASAGEDTLAVSPVRDAHSAPTEPPTPRAARDGTAGALGARPPTTGELEAAVAPSRTPLLVAVALAAVVALALGGWALLGLLQPPRASMVAADAGLAGRAAPTGADAGVATPRVRAAADARAADAGGPDAATPRRPTLLGTAALQKSPVQAIVVSNTSGVAWSNCAVYVPGKKRLLLRSLPPGFSRELPLQYFADDPNAPALRDAVEVRCTQGSALLPVRE